MHNLGLHNCNMLHVLHIVLSNTDTSVHYVICQTHIQTLILLCNHTNNVAALYDGTNYIYDT